MARAVARAYGGGGGCIFIYSCSARRISFEISCLVISKEISRAEHEYMNTPPPPPIYALATALSMARMSLNVPQ